MRAYFRNVPFDIENHEEAAAMYSKIYEPLAGEPWVEIFGAKPKEYLVQGFFVGFDAGLRRDLFLFVCQDQTPGKLLHPRFGMRDVFCTELTLSESGEKKNLISFKATFRPAPQQEQSLIAKAASLVAEKKAFLLSQVIAFTSAFSAVNESFFVLSQAKDLISSLNQAMTSETGLGLLASLPARGADALTDTGDKISNLLGSPERLAQLIAEGIVDMSKVQVLRFLDGFLTKSAISEPIPKALCGLIIAASALKLKASEFVFITTKYLPLFSGEALHVVYRLRTLALREDDSKNEPKKIAPTNAILAAFRRNKNPEEASALSKTTGEVFSLAWVP